MVAGVAIAACAIAFVLTFRFTTTTPAAMMSGMGAEFFPRLVIAVIAALGLCIALGIGNPPMQRPPPIPASVWVTLGVLSLYIAAIQLLGMWLASFGLLVGLGRMWGERSYVKLGLAAAALLALIYLVFVRVLKSELPGAWIGPLW